MLGRTFNPLSEYSNRQLVEGFVGRYDTIRNPRGGREPERDDAGTETRVSEFEGTTRIGCAPVEVAVHVTKVKHDGDYVVALAVHPERLDGHEEAVFRLIRGVERWSRQRFSRSGWDHPACVPSSHSASC